MPAALNSDTRRLRNYSGHNYRCMHARIVRILSRVSPESPGPYISSVSVLTAVTTNRGRLLLNTYSTVRRCAAQRLVAPPRLCSQRCTRSGSEGSGRPVPRTVGIGDWPCFLGRGHYSTAGTQPEVGSVRLEATRLDHRRLRPRRLKLHQDCGYARARPGVAARPGMRLCWGRRHADCARAGRHCAESGSVRYL